ncbi:MAG: hypothetical protein SFW35_00245 [Chitinophagales bacterium]|nr:hypothetical protein [Chitinophagales bacterium]
MKLRLAIVFSFLLLTLAVSAQKLEDVVYLKNGSVIRGTILEQQPEGNIKISIMGGSVLVYKMEEVDRIVKEEVLSTSKPKKDIFIHHRGFLHQTQLGTMMASKDGYGLQAGFNLQTVNGYRVFPQLYVGAGVGLDIYKYYQETYLPVFFRIGGEAIKKRISPHYFASVGYSWILNAADMEYDYATYKGGIMYEAGIGMTVHTRSKISWLLSLGYKAHYSEKTYNYYYIEGDGYSNIMSRNYQRITISTGFQF